MPRVNLTDEEARMIEQRRMMENKQALGYNEALTNMLAHIDGIPSNTPWAEVKQHFHTWANESRRTIRP